MWNGSADWSFAIVPHAVVVSTDETDWTDEYTLRIVLGFEQIFGRSLCQTRASSFELGYAAFISALVPRWVK